MATDIKDYELDGFSIDELGLLDPFRKLISKAVVGVVKSGKWFAFCTKAHKDQVDIMAIENDKGKKMGSIIGEKYYPDTVYRSAVYKQFIRSYMCYYEVPTIKKSYDSDAYREGYDKFIITSNLGVIAAWLDVTVEEAANKYAFYLDDAYIDDGEDMFPYVRLVCSKDGKRTIRKPRLKLELSKRGTRVIPMFALKLGVDMLYSRSNEEVLRVSFIKDGGNERILDFTSSPNIVREVYGESNFFFRAFDKGYDGDFLNTDTVLNGYLRLIEMGGSKYDNPLRSLSFARIFKVEYNVDPDLTFVNIDLDSVVETFKGYISNAYKRVKAICSDLFYFELMSEDERKKVTSTLELEYWCESKSIVLGTVFLRLLALFMLAHPMDFPGYTGLPKHEYSEEGIKGNIGIDTDDEEICVG